MTGVLIPAGGRVWRLLADPAPREAARLQALLSAQLLDELTEAPPLAAVEVFTATLGMSATATAGGRIGLVGRPEALFPDPWPAPAPAVEIRAETDEHLPVVLATALGPQPDMPERYALTDLGEVSLHRRPTSFSGRVLSRATGPVAGATIAVAAYWPTFAAIAGAGLAADAVCVWAGLYADRPAGATLQRRNLSFNADTKILNLPAARGASQLLLSDRLNLVVAGPPLAIEPGDPEREEYIAIAAIDTALSADQPALVTLEHPLRRAHAAGATVTRTSFLGAAGAVNTLVRPGRTGDVSLYLDGLAGLTAANRIVQIGSAGLADEYHSFSLWQGDTDAAGRFRLPPIHRAAHLELDGPPLSDPVRVSLNAPGDALADIVVD